MSQEQRPARLVHCLLSIVRKLFKHASIAQRTVLGQEVVYINGKPDHLLVYMSDDTTISTRSYTQGSYTRGIRKED